LKVKNLCSNISNEDDFKTLSDMLNLLKSDGSALRDLAQTLKTAQSEQMSANALCRALASQFETAKEQISMGLSEMNAIKSACTGKNDAKCSVINSSSSKFSDLSNQITQTLKKIAGLNASCKNASTDNLDQGLVDTAQALKNDKDVIDKMISDLKLLADQAGKGQGISIEAENETSSFIYPASQRPATNTKEMNPSWRPPYLGTGVWYLAVGGEYLTYNFSVPASGKYNVWVRDYVDNFQAKGIRKIVISFDGNNYGTFAENNSTVPANNKNGVLAWHKVGSGISLKSGQHTMKVAKEATTRGAAILDSFYLTTGNEIPPEK